MLNLYDRRVRAREIRKQAADNAFDRPRVEHRSNNDESQYADFRGNFHKTLPQDQDGFVDPQAYRQLVRALESGKPAEFEAIPQSGQISASNQRGLANPRATLAYTLEGPDPSTVTIPPAPDYSSRQTGAEMIELYWMALARDVSFVDYGSDATISDARNELNSFNVLNAKSEPSGFINTDQVFRGNVFGSDVGPFVPQFYLRSSPFNAAEVEAEITTYPAGADYMEVFDEWLNVQRGADTSGNAAFDSTERLMRNLRDMAAYVRLDRLVQSYLFAAQQLFENGQGVSQGIVDDGNPYRFSGNQIGFVTFGLEHLNTLLGEVVRRALQAAWWQKWRVHRRLRPEVMSGRVDAAARDYLGTQGVNYPRSGRIASGDRSNVYGVFEQGVNNGAPQFAELSEDLLLSTALERTFMNNGTFLLPQAYPEGSPTHPSYPAGHATAAGACGTILKAFFNESVAFQDLDYPAVNGSTIVEANQDGTALQAYTQADAADVTVGTELNKLSFQHATSRSFAGVHYRSDNFEGLLLGEKLAIQLLQEQTSVFNEDFSFTLQMFDGPTITIP